MKKIILLLTLSIVLAGCNNSDPKELESSTNNSIPISITSDTKDQNTKNQDNVINQKTNESTDEVNYTSYDNPNFSLSYPSTWQSVDVTTFNNPVIKYAVSNPHPKAPFADNINVVIEPNATKASSAKDIIDGVVDFYTQYGEGAGITDYEQIDFKL